MMHHRATPPGGDAATITATAFAIADTASAALCSAADATCHHPRPSTAGRWTPSLITAGAISAVLGVVLAARSTAAVTAGLLLQLHKAGDGATLIHAKRRTCPPSHQCSIGCSVRRLYVCHQDIPKHHLVRFMDWVMAARPVEDAAGGR